MEATASTTPAAERDDRMPAGIPFIVSNEFAERFCYYGINSILAIYLTSTLHFTDGKAATWQAMFKSGAYFFPLVGAIVSDVFWAKFRTIFVFSIFYATGCALLAAFGHTQAALVGSLFLVALGTGGIKPCVSTNVGDQFTAKNSHLIERAYSWFYLAINAGSSISIYLCPVLLANPEYGPRWAFGMPAVMMMFATLVFVAGRSRYAVVPPAGKAWVKEVFSAEGLKLVGSLSIIYLFVAFFWMLWDQSNGNTWTLQAQSSLMDKNLGFGFTLLPAQIQVVNGLFILAFAPMFTYGVFPFVSKFTKVTPLRKIGAGLFLVAGSFLIVAWIENEIQSGHTVSAWWQILAYAVLTCSEILVSITALEFSYKQAPLRIKSFIMSLFLLSTALGNLMIAGVNHFMEKPIATEAFSAGEETWITLKAADGFVQGQKINFTSDNGVQVLSADGKTAALAGTYLAAAVEGNRIKLSDAITRQPLKTQGELKAGAAVSTYYLVGPIYFLFFSALVVAMGIIFVFVAMAYKEKDHVRT